MQSLVDLCVLVLRKSPQYLIISKLPVDLYEGVKEKLIDPSYVIKEISPYHSAINYLNYVSVKRYIFDIDLVRLFRSVDIISSLPHHQIDFVNSVIFDIIKTKIDNLDAQTIFFLLRFIINNFRRVFIIFQETENYLRQYKEIILSSELESQIKILFFQLFQKEL